MIDMPIAELAGMFGHHFEGDPTKRFRGVTIDSRNPCPDCLFVVIRGDHYDAHDFVESAYKNGARVAIVERPVDSDIVQIVVKNSREALAVLANHWRNQCSAVLIGLTGSNGKTTVKAMLQQILERQGPTLATRGNFNNDIGVPLTLFRLEKNDQYGIIEMGANHISEIAGLARTAQPDIAYVNNVSAAHLSGFGDVNGVIAAKGELYDYCLPKHSALFNLDEAATQHWMPGCLAETQLTCAMDQPADIQANWTPSDSAVEVSFQRGTEHHQCSIEVMGEHNARNALAAVSLAVLAGVDFDKAVMNLQGFSGVGGRLQRLSGPNQSCILNDSYNANPSSLEAGVKVLCSLGGRAWLALGDMGELGELALPLHQQSVARAKQLGVEKLFTIGEFSTRVCVEFGNNGYQFDDIDEMARAIGGQISKDVTLLVKGSRSAGMDRLVNALQNMNSDEDLSDVG
ncbi:MAG: UDP-N-acetylmuramoyl-tripeptide--D-alanyl-D-alanine ligase [Gammaproteobacteria bacterium]|jgi:UDP-N-acetylmuramoyl-tripeptide--D-alanyl-D-alanine ligase